MCRGPLARSNFSIIQSKKNTSDQIQSQYSPKNILDLQ